VAQDAAGNANTASTSTDNTVTFAPQTGVTRFEETDAAVSYSPTGPWETVGSDFATFSGGTAVGSDVPGETATFTFTGPSVSWIGLRCNECGIARVSIDGGAATMVDTAGPGALGSGLTSEVVFSASGLADVSHTMVITVTGNTSSLGAGITVDAFDVGGVLVPSIRRPVPTTRIEEDDPAVTYIGNWIIQTDARVSAGSVSEATEMGARATVSFTGTAVQWVGARAPVTGIANIFLDGAPVGEVDTFAASGEQARVVLFRALDLAPGPHTLTIEVTGIANPASQNTFIVVDAFDVTP
jgi:hypothetical protein